MSDLQESFAVPETDTGGDERFGLFLAGATLVALGWGFGVVLNLLLHAAAPASGLPIGPVVLGTTWGPYAWATAIIGLLTGGVGTGILWVARSAPSGPLVLPGHPYQRAAEPR